MSEPLILASASPRRRALLTRLGCPFTVVEARVVEDEDPLLDPRIMVARNAARKADWVAVQHPDAWVLGADTTVCIDGHALNKPADLTEARAMLRRLSGRTHSVFTGLALRRFDRGVAWDATDTCDVTSGSWTRHGLIAISLLCMYLTRREPTESRIMES
jgi:septum formation protein